MRLTIDGIAVEAPEGTSVLRAALAAGIGIPKLCATDSLAPFGSCRVCLVEIQGRKGTPASCTTPVEAGMVVRTQTETLARVRKGVLELYISDHPLDCLTCAANGDCELQDVAGEVGLREVRYGMAGANHLGRAERRIESLLQLRSVEVHRLLTLCARVRRDAGNVCTHSGRSWLRLRHCRQRSGPASSIPNACRAARACRRVPPPR